MFAQIKAYSTWIKWIGIAGLVAFLCWKVYGYGVSKTELKYKEIELARVVQYQKDVDEINAQLEVKDAENYALETALAKKPRVEIVYKPLKEKVTNYVIEKPVTTCIADNAEWLSIRADGINKHNQAIGMPKASTVANDTARTAQEYTSDSQILIEDVNNIETCAINARRLKDLQEWLSNQ